MMTSSNGNISALLALGSVNSQVTGEFPTQRPVPWSFDVFFDLRLNEQLSNQLWGWWFETPLRSLWHHCNDDRVECCYNTLQPNIILYTVWQWLRQNMHQRLYSQMTPHNLPSQVSYGVSFVRIWVKIFCVIIAPHCLSLLWHHDGHDGISNHQSHDCLFNCLFRYR